MQHTQVLFSQNTKIQALCQRITEHPELEGTQQNHGVQLLALVRTLQQFHPVACGIDLIS